MYLWVDTTSVPWPNDICLRYHRQVRYGDLVGEVAEQFPVTEKWFGAERKEAPNIVRHSWGGPLEYSTKKPAGAHADIVDRSASCHRRGIPSELVFAEYDIQRV